MQRLARLLPFVLLAVALLMVASRAMAEGNAWPEFPLDPQGTGDAHTIVRGPGHYVSLVKIAVAWAIFALWAGTTDWVSRDCLRNGLDHRIWNSVVFGSFFAAFFLLLVIPLYIFGIVLLLVAYAAPLAAYIHVRNDKVAPHERVLTADHLRFLMANKFRKVGVKIEVEKKASHQQGAPVELSAQGAATPRDNNVNLLSARQSAGFVMVKDLVADALDHRADVVMLDYLKESVEARYQIDGLWHAAPACQRQSGDLMLAVIKVLAALDPNQRVRKQSGTFGAEYDDADYTCRIASQGTDKGERVVVKFDSHQSPLRTLLDLGMREKVRQSYLEQLASPSGLVLVSALPAGGLSTCLRVSLEETDRLTRNCVAVEEAAQRELEIENVEVVTYDAAAGQTPATVLPELIRQYPDLIAVRDLADLETAKILCDQVKAGRMVVATLRAKDAVETLARVLMLKVPTKQFVPAVCGVLSLRLVRKLCTQCRVAYAPTAQTLAKLGLPADRVGTLFREPSAEEAAAQPCAACHGLGFAGRTALFEWLVVDDNLRTEMLKQSLKLDSLRKAARQAGCRSFQEEGILLAAKGVTSLAELTRVLKQ